MIRHLFAWLATLLAVSGAVAQCTANWNALPPLPTLTGYVAQSIAWDSDGPGPAPTVAVLGGNFSMSGGVAAQHVVSYDAASRSFGALGNWASGPVTAMCTSPSGELFVAAQGISPGGGFSYNGQVWRLSGQTWVAIPGVANQLIESIVVLANGDIVVGGGFTAIGAIAASRIARWNGTSWSALGSGCSGRVLALVTLPSGDLVAGGGFANAGGTPVYHVARWDGANWSPYGGFMSSWVLSLRLLPSGEVLASGLFTTAGGVSVGGVARGDGASWSAFGTGPGLSSVDALTVMPNGDIVVASFASVRRWNGATWTVLPNSPSSVNTMVAQPNGHIVIGSTQNARVWNGSAYVEPGIGESANILAFSKRADGSLCAVGTFVDGAGTHRGLATWTGSAWSPFGGSFNIAPRAVVELANGDLVVGGPFSSVAGVPIAGVARWNGSAYSPLGTGISGTVEALAVMGNGDLMVGGSFQTAGGVFSPGLARWNSSVWISMGSFLEWNPASPLGYDYGTVRCLAVLANGDLVIGGRFSNAGGVAARSIVRWNGVAYLPFGSGAASTSPPPETWCVRASGNGFVAGGSFQSMDGVPANGIARWDGSAWSSLGSGVGANGTVRTVLELPQGDLLVGGWFSSAGGTAAVCLARWNGNSWASVAGGANAEVHSLALHGIDVYCSGVFTIVGNNLPATNFAWLRTTCPASAVPYGVACPGPAGAAVFASTSLPWLGGVYAARGTSLPSPAFVASVVGFAPAGFPLASALPEALPGCDLLVTPDLIGLVLPVGGTVTTSVTMPGSTALVGAQLRHQLVCFATDALGNLTTVTSSNALLLTVGAI